jgi:hypothetical protein
MPLLFVIAAKKRIYAGRIPFSSTRQEPWYRLLYTVEEIMQKKRTFAIVEKQILLSLR